MSIQTVVQWIFVVSVLMLLDLIFLVQIPRAVREARRLQRRTRALAALPVVAQFAQSERDIARLNAAFDRVPELEARARAAIASIASTPFLPPVVRDVLRRFAGEVNAFRREAHP
jgi:hypothetical protein